MNRFAFLGAQTDDQGVEWCYVLDTKTGTTLKSRVQQMGANASDKPDVKYTGDHGPESVVFPVDTVTAPGAVKEEPDKQKDPNGEMETAEERAARLKKPKVPPAFSPKMYLDPGKTGGVTDVTQHQ